MESHLVITRIIYFLISGLFLREFQPLIQSWSKQLNQKLASHVSGGLEGFGSPVVNEEVGITCTSLIGSIVHGFSYFITCTSADHRNSLIQLVEIVNFTFLLNVITQVHCYPCATTVVTFQFIRVKCRSKISTKTPSATLFFHNQSWVLRFITFSSYQ